MTLRVALPTLAAAGGVGTPLRAVVTASNAALPGGGTAVARSAQTAVVAP